MLSPFPTGTYSLRSRHIRHIERLLQSELSGAVFVCYSTPAIVESRALRMRQENAAVRLGPPGTHNVPARLFAVRSVAIQ